MSQLDNNFIEALRSDTEELSSQMTAYGEFGEISAASMMRQPATEMECLLHPIFPRVGCVSLVGSSDTGKSSLLRGLAIAVCAGADEYVGFRLQQRYSRALYISTEDDEQAVRFLLHRHNNELHLPIEAFSGLSFIFSPDNVTESVEGFLSRHPTDLVVIDAFADIYEGALNENNRVRAFLQQYYTLAIKHQCLFIFLHHTGKRTEDSVPSKHNAIGSQGFEAKMRLVIELRNDPTSSERKHLCIVKGNYLSAEYKHSSYELHFSEDMVFSATGSRTPFEELRCRDTEREEQRQSKIERIKELKAEGKTLDEIAFIMGYSGKSSISQILKRAEQ